VLCCTVKDEGQSQDSQDKEVQLKYRDRKRIPPGALKFVCFECYILSGIGLCDVPITRTEDFYRLWCIIVYDLQTSAMRRPRPTLGCCAKEEEEYCGYFSALNYWPDVGVHSMLHLCIPTNFS
jgi:hypothetical protein